MSLSERQRKIERFILNAAREYNKGPYLKVPVSMAQYALINGKSRQLQCYLACHFLYSGKAYINEKTYKEIANTCSIHSRTVKRSFNWLINRNWIGKNPKSGIFHIRGIDYIRRKEGFQFRRSVKMRQSDLEAAKAFFIGSVLSSIDRTIKIQEKESGAAGKRRPANQSRSPISTKAIQKALKVSKPTAIKYRKYAERFNYIDVRPNLVQLEGITPKAVPFIRQNSNEDLKVKLFGSTDSLKINPNQLRVNRGFVYAQLSNLIKPFIPLCKRT